MSTSTTMTHETIASSRHYFGFWLYIMSDCLLFGSLFATYVVLQGNVADGASAHELFDLPFVLIETIILLTSSLVCGLAVWAAYAKRKTQLIVWLALTGVLGLAFIGMELHEFVALASQGQDWTRSAFLSAFFTLVGTHGLHVLSGLIWLTVLLVKLTRQGITEKNILRLSIFSLFWHFLDIIWILVFSIVYLLGAQP